jgi:Predicted methyltransferases
MYEEFLREDIDNLKMLQKPPKGELTIVISDNNIKAKKIDEEKIVNKAKKYLKKYSLKDSVNLILETEKINRKKVYNLCLKIKDEESN